MVQIISWMIFAWHVVIYWTQNIDINLSASYVPYLFTLSYQNIIMKVYDWNYEETSDTVVSTYRGQWYCGIHLQRPVILWYPPTETSDTVVSTYRGQW